MASAFLMWSGWCALMAHFGEPFSHPAARAVARITSVALPAAVYLWRTRDERSADPPPRPVRGVVAGLLATGLFAAVILVPRAGAPWSVPVGVATWLNFLLLSPVAEELLFRKASLEHLRSRAGAFAGVAVSAALFAAFHVPSWLLLGEAPPAGMLATLTTLLAYGLVFGGLYRSTGSLWAPLLPHLANNILLAGFDG